MDKLKKKIIVIEESPLGSNILETTAEETKPIGRLTWHLKKSNPNRECIWKQTNKWKETFEIVRYKDTNAVMMFIQGGVHRTIFKFDEAMVKKIIDSNVNVRVSNTAVKESRG